MLCIIMCPVQVSFVGQTEEAAREAAQAGGYGDKIKVSKTSFKANSKASLPMSIQILYAPKLSFDINAFSVALF